MQGKRILIVDDDALNRELLQTVLTRSGYRIAHANSGKTAITSVSTDPPDLILLDVRMVGMSGYEVCQHLKTDEHTRHIPIMMLTAFDNPSEQENARRAGADEFFPKMNGWRLLIERIKSLLD